MIQYKSKKWPHGQAVKTPPSQGGITSSILVGATIKKEHLFGCSFFVVLSRIELVVRPSFDGQPLTDKDIGA